MGDPWAMSATFGEPRVSLVEFRTCLVYALSVEHRFMKLNVLYYYDIVIFYM